jgi:AraC-like DNA-binding protein
MIIDIEMRSSDSPLVHSIWRSRSEGGGSFISTAVSQWEMVVTKQEDHLTLSVRGPETQASPAPVPVDAEFFGIVFRHGVFMPQLPKSKLVDHEIHLNETIKNAFQFLGSTWQFPTYENVDTFINRLLRANILSLDILVEDALRGQMLNYSRRSIQRHFLHVTGLTYKTIQQIERARHASSLLTQGLSPTEVVYREAYYDQAHLTNALKRFFGQTPAQIANQTHLHNGVFFQDESS